LQVPEAVTALTSCRHDVHSPLSRLWQILQIVPPTIQRSLPSPLPPAPPLTETVDSNQEGGEIPTQNGPGETEAEVQEEEYDEATQNFLDILDSVDFGDQFENDKDRYQLPPRLLDHGNAPSFLVGRTPQPSNDGTPPAASQPPMVSPSPPSISTTSMATYTSPFLNLPRQGEIINAFGEYYQDIHKRADPSATRQIDTSKPLVMGVSVPQLPLQPSLRHNQKNNNNNSDKENTSRNFVQQSHPRFYSPVDDPANASAVELLLKMNHPGINLHDLTELLEDSRHWNKPQPEKEEKKEDEGVLVAMGTGGSFDKTSSTTDQNAPTGPAPPLKDHPEYSKYFKLLKGGTALEEVKEIMKKDGKDPTIADLDPEKSLSSQRPSMADQEAVIVKPKSVANAQKALQEALLRKKEGPKADIIIPKRSEEDKDDSQEENQNPQARLMAALSKNKSSDDNNKDEDMPLRTDPEYSKYFRMLKMGMSKEQIQHAMTRDEKDPTIIDLGTFFFFGRSGEDLLCRYD